MKLDAVTAAVPSRLVTNDEVVGLLLRHSRPVFNGNLHEAAESVAFLLERSGAKRRYWLGSGESPLDLVQRAFDEALDSAGCERGEIDLLIFAGIDRGFIEPGNAYFVAAALGLDRVECFDISDACHGFSRSVNIVDALLRTGRYRRAVVVNAEFGMSEGGAVYPGLYTLRHETDLEWAFPAYTIGEVATVTILSAGGGEWDFRFASRPDLAELCTIPVAGYDRWVPPGSKAGAAGLYQFSSFGGEMEEVAWEEIAKLFAGIDINGVDAIFVHTAAARPWMVAAAERGLVDVLHNPYAEYGNVASAAIPLGVALAWGDGRIGRGDTLVACVGSAGMAFSVYRWSL
jgi:3-oxoacyl-[acyl-carrier-protein] synthase III